MIVTVNWGNVNEGRAYPLAEHSTRVDDTGVSFPDSIVVDMGIVLPAYYSQPRVSSVYVSPDVASITISHAGEGLLTGIYSRQSIVPYKSYPLAPVVPGASGWVSFGTYTPRVYTRYTFSTAGQSGLETRVCRVVEPPGVTSIHSLFGGMSAGIDGIVPVEATGGLVVEQDPVNPSNIIIRLDAVAQTRYAGPCGTTASEKRCAAAPIRYINNVTANSEGRITIQFE